MYGGRSTDDIAHHNLWELGKLSRKIIDIAGDSDGSIDIVEKIIKEMHDLDKSALAFRYGMDKNNNPPKLPAGLYDPK